MLKDKSHKGISSFIGIFSALSIVFSLTVVMLGNIFSVEDDTKPTSADNKEIKNIVVIDPGHGGEDGGAIAVDGTVEKILNLDFCKTIHDLCGLFGVDSILTRDSDTLLYDKYSELDDYTGKKKVFDLKNRLRFTEEYGENAIFIGIHMNKFSEGKYSGTQVYYSPNSAESMPLAEALQGKVKASLQPENERAIKKAGSSIFLLNRLQIPAILAECGFLSNEAETARLNSAEYKKEFSLTTAVVIGEFINSRNN